jgi:hypothetical protein
VTGPDDDQTAELSRILLKSVSRAKCAQQFDASVWKSNEDSYSEEEKDAAATHIGILNIATPILGPPRLRHGSEKPHSVECELMTSISSRFTDLFTKHVPCAILAMIMTT